MTTIVIGPVVGLLAAGAAVYATTRTDNIGDTSRAVGSATISAYNYTSRLCTKYEVLKKLKSAGEVTASKLVEVNNEYKLTEKAQVVGTKALEGIIALDNKYEISRSVTNILTQRDPIPVPIVRAERI